MIEAAASSGITARQDTAVSLDEVIGAAPGADLVEIGRLAVHLAAFQRAILPVAVVKLPEGAAHAGQLRRCGRELATALHWLDRHLTGDARVVRAPTDRLFEAVQAAAATHRRLERALIAALAETLGGREIVELVRSYHRASLKAPTRPHPLLARRGATGWLAFTLAARIDAIRDVLDNRSVRSRIEGSAAQALDDLAQIPWVEDKAELVASPMTPALTRS